MTLSWHLVWTVYGWWFPNDPRGSWSAEVWSPSLQCLGSVEERGRRLAQPSRQQLRNWFSTAQKHLKYRPIVLDRDARNIVVHSIMTHARLHHYIIQALAVMPDHVHIVLERHAHPHQKVVQSLKSVSSRALRKYLGLAALPATRDGIRAAGSTANQRAYPVWSRGYWVRFLAAESNVAAAISYVNGQRESASVFGQP